MNIIPTLFLFEARVCTTPYFFTFLSSIKQGAYHCGQAANGVLFSGLVISSISNQDLTVNILNHLFIHSYNKWLLGVHYRPCMVHSINKTKPPPSWSLHAGGSGPIGMTPPLGTWLVLVLEERSILILTRSPTCLRSLSSDSGPCLPLPVMSIPYCFLTLEPNTDWPIARGISALQRTLSWEWATYIQAWNPSQELLHIVFKGDFEVR